MSKKSAPPKSKSLESWIWDAACSIRGAKDAPKDKDVILPLIALFLNRVKPKAQQGKVILVNASQIFEKGDPKNFIPDGGIARIADTLLSWKEEGNLSRVVRLDGLKENDYNISPSRYIRSRDAETYRPISEIVAELDVIEAEARETDKALCKVLKQLGV